MGISTEKSTSRNARLTPSRLISSARAMKFRMASSINLFKMKIALTVPFTHIFQPKLALAHVLRVVNANTQELNFMIIQYVHVGAKKKCAQGECFITIKTVNVNA